MVPHSIHPCPHIQIHFGEAGACERIVRAVIDYANKEPSVKMWGQRAVISLAVDGDVAPKLKEAKRLFEMVKIMKDDSNATMAAANKMRGGPTLTRVA